MYYVAIVKSLLVLTMASYNLQSTIVLVVKIDLVSYGFQKGVLMQLQPPQKYFSRKPTLNAMVATIK